MSSGLSFRSVGINTECVERLKAENPEKFSELVTSQLSILLDLGNGILAEMIEERKRFEESKSPFLRRKKAKVTNQLFGNQLTHHHITRIMSLLTYLQQPDNLRLEGLFRKTGSIERQRSLREKLDTLDMVMFPNSNYTIHDCAGVLKAFLSELPEPLLTARHFNAYSQVSGLSDELKQVSSLQLLVQLLPAENFSFLRHLMSLLSAVNKEPENLMNASNLAIVFTPHLAMPKTLTIDEQRMVTADLTRAVEVMISNADIIFDYPAELIADVTQYLQMLDRAPSSAVSVRTTKNCGSVSVRGNTPKNRFRLPQYSKKTEKDLKEDEQEEDDEIIISSSVVFADRKASKEAAITSNTATALADLHSFILSMPDSSRKRKLISRMTPSGKRQDSTDVTPSVQNCAPVARLFTSATGKKSSMPEGPAERRVTFAEEQTVVPTFNNIHAQKIFEDEYDSDDLQCSLLDKSETSDDNISYDDTMSLDSNEYDDSDKENNSAPVFPTKILKERALAKHATEVEPMSSETVKGSLKIVVGIHNETNCSPVIGTPAKSVLTEKIGLPCAVEKLRGYISPLAFPYIVKNN